MAANDKLLLDGILDERVSAHLPSDDRGEAFELFAFEQILKDADLSRDELAGGSLDGRDDGGVDGMFLFVNGHLLTDTEDFQWPRKGAELTLWLFTCKHHDTFQQAPLDKLIASLSELLDLGLKDADLKGAYSEDILRFRSQLAFVYRKLSPSLTNFELNIVYASRGDTSSVGDAVQARANQLEALVSRMFNSSIPHVRFIGALELIEAYRRTPTFCLELPFLECLWRGNQYVLLCPLRDYNRFATDDHGAVKRYLLDSNVRDSLGLNAVNGDILSTLHNPGPSDFWWMNNGITILGTRASVTGKLLSIDDVQIVNGLQTTETIARYFREGGDDSSRSVLVKVIVCQDATARDEIIKATNNQTSIEHASLRATDKLQRDIEDVFESHGAGLHYERRKNHHVNQGVDPSQIVSPLYVASGAVSLLLKSPYTASRLRQRFMRIADPYRTVFSPELPLDVWPAIARTLRVVDSALER